MIVAACSANVAITLRRDDASRVKRCCTISLDDCVSRSVILDAKRFGSQSANSGRIPGISRLITTERDGFEYFTAS